MKIQKTLRKTIKPTQNPVASSHNYLVLTYYFIIYKEMRKKKHPNETGVSCSDNNAADEWQSCGVPGDRIYSPCFSTSFSGSTPGDRIKNIGVAGPDSSKVVAKSRDLPATYLLPSFSSTKSLPERNNFGQFVQKMQIPLQTIS